MNLGTLGKASALASLAISVMGNSLGQGSQGTHLNIGYSNIISFCTLMSKVKIRPLWTNLLTVAGGFEYRSEDYIQNDDPNSKTGNLTAVQLPIGRLINAVRYTIRLLR
jgi:hypothetical protein